MMISHQAAAFLPAAEVKNEDLCRRGRHAWLVTEYKLAEVSMGADGAMEVGGQILRGTCQVCGVEYQRP